MEKEKIISVDEFDKKNSLDENSVSMEEISEDLSEENNADLDISKVRERTFNDELSDLVTKIRSNESLNDVSEIEDEIENGFEEEIVEDELLNEFHKLFYKSINLFGINDINTSFNQFQQSTKFLKNNIEQDINSELFNLTLSNYTILYYNIMEKCYTPFINYIDDIDEVNIVIDTNEDLYSRIIDNNKGIIFDNKSIRNNIFMRKRFSSQNENEDKNSLYFVSLKNLITDFYTRMDSVTDEILPDKSLFPILVIQLEEGREEDAESIYDKIGSTLTIHFILLIKKLLRKSQNIKLRNLHNVFRSLDYNFRIFFRSSEDICLIIKCNNYLDKEILFILKYLNSKLMDTLPEKSIISRIEKGKFIIFIQKADEKIVNQHVEEFNKLYKNIFHIQAFRYGSDDFINLFSA